MFTYTLEQRYRKCENIRISTFHQKLLNNCDLFHPRWITGVLRIFRNRHLGAGLIRATRVHD